MDYKKLALTSAVMTGVLWLVAFVMGKIGYTVQQLYAISPVSAVTPTVGTKTISFLAGYFPQVANFTIPALVILFISSFLILLVGGFVRDLLKLKSRGKVQDLAIQILLGSGVFYVLIAGLKLISWQSGVGLLIHTLITAYLVAWIMDKI